MAVSVRSSAASAVRPARCVSVRCQASGAQKALPAALVSFAAATLLATPAFAGVVIQEQQLKKVFQNEAPVAAAKSTGSAPAAAKAVTAPKAAPAPKAESYSEGGSFPGGLLLLPVSLGAIGAAGFALTKVDDGFTDFFNSTIIKDSYLEGAGYEVAIKDGVAAVKMGTKKVKAGTKKGKK